tara:strand:+ start:766 stop:1533 length:768 start_codon:yes stop_codon:yes gene_type:complete
MLNKFKNSKYILRLDDASHFSDLYKWSLIENILEKNNIRPLVAVIPKNEDNKLFFNKKNKNFWNDIKRWKNKGWTIGMHGYKHIYHKVKRRKNIFPFYNRSEFSQLPIKEQRDKIKKSFSLFKKNKIIPNVWIAPSHCFDYNTLKALEMETPIRIISDGFYLSPHFEKGFVFIPQQLWKLKQKYFGLWTICLHPDSMSIDEIKKFSEDLNKFSTKNHFVQIEEINHAKIRNKYFNVIYSKLLWFKYELNYFLRNG